MKTFNEILKELKIKQEKYNNCKHDLEDELCGFMTLGRFGGNCVKLYKCKKCGGEFTKDSDYGESIYCYDESGRLKDTVI